MDSYDDFKKYFGSSKSGKFWKIVTTKSLIPLEDIPDKETLLKEIFSEIESSKYTPSKPRGYISIDKGSCVTRLLPVFNLKDICVYFYATKKLEKDIAGNRVQNTYGGWSLGGEIRKNEEEEVKYIAKNMREYEMPDGTVIGLDESLMYPIEASFNPRAWSENWINFTGTLYTHSRADKYNFVAELDVANFYDNISIEILEDKLKKHSKESSIIEILLNFLRNWDRGSNSPDGTPRGIPQDEVADCSRIIANFYLQDFDSAMYELCENYGAKYFRYADDQVILAQSEETLREIITKASIMILKHGLCFNHKKANIMPKTDLEQYFAFDWFIERQDKKVVDKDDTKKDLVFYRENKMNLKNSGISVLLRSLSLAPTNIDKEDLDFIKDEIIRPDFLSSPKLSSWQLAKIYTLSDAEDQKQILSTLSGYSNSLLHNRFHYVLLSFLKIIKDDSITKDLHNRINILKGLIENA